MAREIDGRLIFFTLLPKGASLISTVNCRSQVWRSPAGRQKTHPYIGHLRRGKVLGPTERYSSELSFVDHRNYFFDLSFFNPESEQ